MRSDLVSPVIFIAFLCLSLSEQVWLLYFQQKHLVERRYFFIKVGGKSINILFLLPISISISIFYSPGSQKIECTSPNLAFQGLGEMHPSSNNPTGIRSVQRGFQWISQFQLSWNYSFASLSPFFCSSSEWDTVIEDGLNSI